MQDVSSGVERNRAWPQRRKKNLPDITKEQNELFRQYQWATKYWAPNPYEQAMLAVKGTPLLPRDIMTMIMSGRLGAIVMPDGKVKYPMAAVRDVSASLDVITSVPGQSIRRGPELWEEYTPAGGGGDWTVKHDEVIAAPVASIEVTDLGGASSIMILCLAVTCSASAFRQVRLSTDNGASFYDQTGDYAAMLNTGALNTQAAIVLHSTATTAARYAGGEVQLANTPGVPKVFNQMLNVDPRIFLASEDEVNAVQILPSSGNLTGGRVVVLTK